MRGLVIVAVCVVVLFPVYWMILSTFQPEGKTLSFPPPLVPPGFDSSAISELFRDQPIGSWLAHSVLVALIAVAITLVTVGLRRVPLGGWNGTASWCSACCCCSPR